MIGKTEMVVRTATKVLNRYSRRTTKIIIGAFLEELMDALVRDGEVYLEGFGGFKVRIHAERKSTLYGGTFKKGERRGKRVVTERDVRVYFSKSPKLKGLLKEKYRGKVRRRRAKQES